MNFLELFDRIDSFKRVVLLFLTVAVVLLMGLGKVAIDNYADASKWESSPHILKTELPCSLIQIREGHYLITIAFPTPPEYAGEIEGFRTSFLVNRSPAPKEFSRLCEGLVFAINSNEAERVLKPYIQDYQEDRL